MILGIARAIAHDDGYTSDEDWEAIGEDGRAPYLRKALRVLDAMREPTEEMIEGSYGRLFSEHMRPRQALREIWMQMIIDAKGAP